MYCIERYLIEYLYLCEKKIFKSLNFTYREVSSYEKVFKNILLKNKIRK